MPRDAAGNNYPVQNASEDTVSVAKRLKNIKYCYFILR